MGPNKIRGESFWFFKPSKNSKGIKKAIGKIREIKLHFTNFLRCRFYLLQPQPAVPKNYFRESVCSLQWRACKFIFSEYILYFNPVLLLKLKQSFCLIASKQSKTQKKKKIKICRSLNSPTLSSIDLNLKKSIKGS